MIGNYNLTIESIKNILELFNGVMLIKVTLV